MRNLSIAVKSSLCSLQLEKSLHSNEDPAQPKKERLTWVKGRGHLSWGTDRIIRGLGWLRGRNWADQLQVELGFRTDRGIFPHDCASSSRIPEYEPHGADLVAPCSQEPDQAS